LADLQDYYKQSIKYDVFIFYYIQVPDGTINVNFLPQAIKRQNGLRFSTIW